MNTPKKMSALEWMESLKASTSKRALKADRYDLIENKPEVLERIARVLNNDPVNKSGHVRDN